MTERVSVGAIHESPDSIASPTVINTECEMQNYGAVGVGGLVATSVTSGSECPPDIHSIPSVSLRYSTTHIVGRGLAPAAPLPKGEPCPLTAIAELSQGASQIKPLTSGEVAPKVTERESQGASQISAELMAELEKAELTAAWRVRNIENEQGRVRKCLEEAEIPFILLKGAVVRDFYPEAWMRTSSDIDVLVPRDELSHAICAIEDGLGYQVKTVEPHDASLFAKSGVHLDMHTLFEGDREDCKLLDEAWVMCAGAQIQNLCANAQMQNAECKTDVPKAQMQNAECEMQNYGAVGVGGLVATSVTSGSECPPDIHSIPSVSLRYSTTHIVGRGLAPAAPLPKGEPCPLTAIAELSQGASQIKPLTSGEVAPKVTERESQGAIHESHDGVAKAQGGSYERFLTPEHFYFYHVAHMAAHMRNGGCGIRPFIDLYLIRRNMPCERAVLDGMLSEYGLARFEAASVALAERWMCADTLSRKCKMQNAKCKMQNLCAIAQMQNAECKMQNLCANAQMQNAECKMQNLCANAQTQNGGLSEEQLSAFEEYVLTGGVYGSGEQYVAAKQRGGKQGKAKYVLGRIFMPYEQLKLRHPRLDGHRWLTPVFEVYRWCSLVVPSRLRRSGKELSSAMRVDNAKVTSVEELLNSLEL